MKKSRLCIRTYYSLDIPCRQKLYLVTPTKQVTNILSITTSTLAIESPILLVNPLQSIVNSYPRFSPISNMTCSGWIMGHFRVAFCLSQNQSSCVTLKVIFPYRLIFIKFKPLFTWNFFTRSPLKIKAQSNSKWQCFFLVFLVRTTPVSLIETGCFAFR